MYAEGLNRTNYFLALFEIGILLQTLVGRVVEGLRLEVP
jgi:hypothetical protein